MPGARHGSDARAWHDPAIVSPTDPLRIIVNPAAGGGRVRRVLDRVVDELRAQGRDFEVAETARPGDATVLARDALAEGIRFLVAVGGDGTCHEVANGMFRLPAPSAGSPPAAPELGAPEPVAADAVLGIVPAGSGCDFARSFDFGRRRRGTVASHLAGGATRLIDVGTVACTGANGVPVARVFLNIAEVGYGAEVARRAGGYPARLGRFRYLAGTYGALRTLTRDGAVLRAGSHEVTVPLVNLVVANARYFGGGMEVAPGAAPDDGRFAVQAFTGHRAQLVVKAPKLYTGRHVPHPQVLELDVPEVEVRPSAPLLVETDGEVIGSAPARFAVAPLCLRLKVAGPPGAP